jgi:hypothetical protein
LENKTDKEVFDFFADWYSRNINASTRLQPDDWEVIPYEDAHIVKPSGNKRTSYMHLVRDGDCIGFPLPLLSLEKAYQKLLERKNSQE